MCLVTGLDLLVRATLFMLALIVLFFVSPVLVLFEYLYEAKTGKGFSLVELLWNIATAPGTVFLISHNHLTSKYSDVQIKPFREQYTTKQIFVIRTVAAIVYLSLVSGFLIWIF